MLRLLKRYLPHVVTLIALCMCSALRPLAAQAPLRTAVIRPVVAKPTTAIVSDSASDDWTAMRDARVAPWLRTAARPKQRNYWETGALIGGVVGAVIGGQLALAHIRQEHSGAGGPEYVLVNGIFPGFVIGGVIGAVIGTQIHSIE